MLDRSRVAEQLAEFEQLLERYFRRDPVEEAIAGYNREVGEFNAWVERRSAELDAERAALERQLRPIRDLEDRFARLGERLDREQPDRQSESSVAAFNALVSEYNAFIQRHRELIEAYRRDEAAHNARVDAHNREFDERRKRLDASQAESQARIGAYRLWVKNAEDERFFRDLNRLLADLMEESRRTGAAPGLYADEVVRLRMMRAELGDYARRREAEGEHGLLVHEVTVCGERCFMYVDNGSGLVSLTPELVDALDLKRHVGDEVEVNLAGGIRIRAPQLVIPTMSVQGMPAEYVKAIVLRESSPGIDGCLGLSFLNRFEFEIRRSGPDRLLLNPKREDEAAPAGFDVFICHKSEDYACSKVVFDMLTAAGYRPFLSEVSLQAAGETNYRKAIDTALAAARHLVVVSSSQANVEAPWVEAEWGLFVTLLRSGRKRGNVVTVLCGGMPAHDLPPALAVFQAIGFESPGWQSTLLNFLPRSTRPPRP